MRPSDEELFKAAAEVMRLRGYLVIGKAEWMAPEKIGSIVHKFGQFDSPSPLRVVSRTDAEDWRGQIDAFRELMFDKWKGPKHAELSEKDHFYRVITD
jgi:hypothetical protein